MKLQIAFLKKITLSVLSIFISGMVFCQTFMHGAGVTVLVGSSKGGDVTVAEGLTYYPRFNFLENETLSVSAGIPITLGISGSYSANYGSNGYYENNSLGFVVNAPLMINLNMGRGSTKENESRYGYFVGAGFGYHHGDFVTVQTDGYSDYNTSKSVNTFGPAANAGFRIGVGRKHRNIEVRFSYMKGINEDKPNIYGIGGAFNF
jgi:hypothetical protein